MPLPLIAAIAGGTALAKGISGLLQKSQANKIASQNPFPTMQVQDEYSQNVALANQMAMTGLPQEQYNNQQNAIGRNQAGGLSVLSRSANPSAGIASLIRAGNDANMNLNAQDAMARQRNQMNLMQQRQILGNQKQSVWDWNNKQRYVTNLEREQALRGAGNQNLMGAFNDITGGAAMIATGGLAPLGGVSQAAGAGLSPLMMNPLGNGNTRQYNPLFGYNPYA